MQKAYDFETWCEASGNRALQSLSSLLLCDNGTPSITEDYLPCARMVFTMSLEKKMGICAKGALKVNYRVE